MLGLTMKSNSMKSEIKKIFYCYVQNRSFINTDLVELEKKFWLKRYTFVSTRKYLIPLSFIQQALYLLFFGWKFDYIVCFFAGYHSLWPALFARLTGKKCIIFLAGTDCFKYPSFHYGNYTKRWYGMSTCLSARNASILVPVSSNLILKTSPYYKTDSVVQGIYHWCKNLKTPHQVIPFEYNTTLFQRQDIPRIENSFITIAFGIRGTSFIRKGIDKTIMIAEHFSEYTFTIVGCAEKDFPVKVPQNVKLVPPVSHTEVPTYLSSHQFYLQLSIAEGFPSAVCEAMLCECIPIGSEVAAIPEIIGSNGFLIPEREDIVILDTISKAVAYQDKESMAKSAREHIVQNYGPGKRIDALLELFN